MKSRIFLFKSELKNHDKTVQPDNVRCTNIENKTTLKKLILARSKRIYNTNVYVSKNSDYAPI